MSDQDPDFSNAAPKPAGAAQMGQRGGAGPDGPPTEVLAVGDKVPMPENNAAELGALHVRVIALESLVISLLAAAADEHLERAREMARYISPRPGFTHHPLTTRAAAHMVDLVERASRFHGRSSS
jgi:hypothetical protein